VEDKGHRDDVMEVLKRVCEEVEKDPEVAKKAEEFQRKYGTLTAEDLAMTFTI
jgi:hypothetical protein